MVGGLISWGFDAGFSLPTLLHPLARCFLAVAAHGTGDLNFSIPHPVALPIPPSWEEALNSLSSSNELPALPFAS